MMQLLRDALWGSGHAGDAENRLTRVAAVGPRTAEREGPDRPHTCVRRSQPFGDEGWTRRTAVKLGLGSSLRPVGRPRKVTGKAEQWLLTPFPRPTDPRTGTSDTHYNSLNQVDWTEDAANNRTTYEYYANTDANAGRLKSTTDPAGKKQYSLYNSRGQLEKTWGDTTYPVKYAYDSYGRRTDMYTYREGTAWTDSDWPDPEPTGDHTAWTLDAGTGLVKEKTYADNKKTTYTYTADGRLLTRTWARTVGGDPGDPLTTSCEYYDDDGEARTWELQSVDYSDDSAHDVAYTYTRMGNQDTVTDAVGTRTFTYRSEDLQLASETITGSGDFSELGRTLTRNYEGTEEGEVPGRYNGLSIGTTYSNAYTYDEYGRLARISGSGLPAFGAIYWRELTGSDLVTQIRFQQTASSKAQSIRSYESNRNLLTSVENQINTSPVEKVSKYEYVNDSVGRRTSTVLTGTAFGADHHWDYRSGYNDRSELTGGLRKTGTSLDQGSLMTPGDFDYAYDPIGNRTSSNVDNDANPTGYTTNAVNAYTASTYPTESFGYDDDGNLTSDAPAGPKLVAAKSFKTHGAQGEFAIDLPLNSPSSAGVECRDGGPTTIELEFNEEVAISDDNLILSSGTLSSPGVTQPTAGVAKYRVELSGTTAVSCFTLRLQNVRSKTGDSPLVGTPVVSVIVHEGDVNSTGVVDDDDVNDVRSHNGQSATAGNCRFDVNVDSWINASDIIITRNLKETTSPSISCALPPAPLGLAYSWDAENRLTQVVTRRDPAGTFYLGDTKVEFKYDYMGRRVRKAVYTYDNGWPTTPTESQVFIYDGWNPVLVLNGANNTSVRIKYTWGLDLSGSVQGAGGIGGLVAAQDLRSGSAKNYWFLYDANGNVGQVLDATNLSAITTAAKYEYDPYGNTIAATGTYAAANPFRFSTKWFDTETGLSYYGYRYYNGRLGRWMSRDPIEETGGVSLYCACGNALFSHTDALGLSYILIDEGQQAQRPDPEDPRYTLGGQALAAPAIEPVGLRTEDCGRGMGHAKVAYDDVNTTVKIWYSSVPESQDHEMKHALTWLENHNAFEEVLKGISETCMCREAAACYLEYVNALARLYRANAYYQMFSMDCKEFGWYRKSVCDKADEFKIQVEIAQTNVETTLAKCRRLQP